MKPLTTVYRLTFLIAVWCAPILMAAQGVKEDTVFLANARLKAVETYTKGIANHSNLFNGLQYKEITQYNADIGHPYYVSDDWAEGSVFYGDNYYENVYLLYDLIRDKVVIEHGYSFFKLQLVSEKIKYFTLQHHTFVRLTEDSLHQINAGFYDLLHNGKAKVYAARRKTTQEKLETDTKRVTYTELAKYFLFLNGVYHPVKTKSSVLRTAGADKSKLRKYMKEHDIHFSKKTREQAIASSARFFDTILP